VLIEDPFRCGCLSCPIAEEINPVQLPHNWSGAVIDDRRPPLTPPKPPQLDQKINARTRTTIPTTSFKRRTSRLDSSGDDVEEELDRGHAPEQPVRGGRSANQFARRLLTAF
jgi:hypothetical protein